MMPQYTILDPAVRDAYRKVLSLPYGVRGDALLESAVPANVALAAEGGNTVLSRWNVLGLCENGSVDLSVPNDEKESDHG